MEHFGETELFIAAVTSQPLYLSSMAVLIKQFLPSMALLALLLMLALDFTGAQTGVCYGRLGDNLPAAADVVALCQRNNIRRMRIYDPDQGTLQALGGSNIELILDVPNPQLSNIAASQDNANTWVQDNIKNYPNVKFRYIAVVSPSGSNAQYAGSVLPAMRNINTAISAAGLAGQIKVSTAFDTTVLDDNTVPPSNAGFKPAYADYLNPIIGFLKENGSPLLVNVYPYFAYIYNKAQIDLNYALFKSEGIVMSDGTKYQNLFYALVDAAYAALEKSGAPTVEIVVSETGWPSDGGDTTTLENAKTYNTNLIQRVKDGTPKRAGKEIETYIFDLFDENQKNPDYEKHFGIFLPNQQPKYELSF